MTFPRLALRSLLPALAVLLLLPGVVLAHAELVESDPADGASIESAAHTLSATFSEPLSAERSRIVVRDAAGNEVARGGVSGDPETMTVDLPALAAGNYLARWTAVGIDGHVERGTIEFSVVEPPPPTASPQAEPTPSPTGPPATPPPTGQPTDPPATVAPTAAPTPSPSASPAGGDGAPTAGATDLLIALGVAGALVAGLLLLLRRRRPA